MAAKGVQSERVSSCVFLHVFLRATLFFFLLCVHVFGMYVGGGCVNRRMGGMAAKFKMFKICWPDRVSQDRLVNGVFWKVLSCSFNEPRAKRPNEACSVCQNSPSA